MPPPVTNPTPPPPPSPTYDPVLGESSDRFFNGQIATIETFKPDNTLSPTACIGGPTALPAADASFTVGYTAANGSYYVTAGNAADRFFATDLVSSDDNQKYYRVANGDEFIRTRAQLPSLIYVNAVRYNTSSRVSQPESGTAVTLRYGVFGSRTQPTDVPVTGSGSYDVRQYGIHSTCASQALIDVGSTANFDFAAKTFNFQTTYTEAGGTFGVYFEGTISGSQLMGILYDNPNQRRQQGTFKGYFYGPQGTEFGLAYAITSGNQPPGAGFIVAKRKP